MSLKAFHIFFVIVSVLVCGITGLWGIRGFTLDGDAGTLAIGIIGAVTSIVLIVYGIRVAKKLKGISYL